MVTKQNKLENGLLGDYDAELEKAEKNLAEILAKRAALKAIKKGEGPGLPLPNKFLRPKEKQLDALIDMVIAFQHQQYIRTCEEFLFMVSGDDDWKGWEARISAGYRDPYDKNSFSALRAGRYGDVSDEWVAGLRYILSKNEPWWRAQIKEIRTFREAKKNVTAEHSKKGSEGYFAKAIKEIKENLLACVPEECRKRGLVE